MSAYSGDGRTGSDEVAITLIPEPASLVLLGMGSLLIASRRQRG